MSTAKSIICFFFEHNLPKPTCWPQVHPRPNIRSHSVLFDHVYTMGGVTRHMLSHLFGSRTSMLTGPKPIAFLPSSLLSPSWFLKLPLFRWTLHVLLGLGKATPIQFLDTPFGLWRAHRPREEKTCETKCKITHCECIKSRQRAVVSSGFVLVTPILSPQISSRELTQVVCKTLRRKGRAFQNIGKKTIFPTVKSTLVLSVLHISMKCNVAR